MDMNDIMEYVPLLAPLLAIQLVLVVVALLDLRKQPRIRGPWWLWVLVILFVNTIGPILYFVIGREEE
jgi:drug/metabolite transporter (DMT)-like permease